MYLAFLLNVPLQETRILTNEVFIYVIGVERVRVGHVVNLCVTHSGVMHLT
jgi:hypothetical protein